MEDFSLVLTMYSRKNKKILPEDRLFGNFSNKVIDFVYDFFEGKIIHERTRIFFEKGLGKQFFVKKCFSDSLTILS